MAAEIRTVEVEFLRPGPPHNQLLSPLTQYLAICGEAGAGTVSVPFEQAALNRRLARLRYGDDDEQDDSARLETLRTVGTDLGEMLGKVPGLTGSLFDHGLEGLINLRIVTSASELAMLPFELSKVPAGSGRPSEEFLALRAGKPVCITRRVRSVTPLERPFSAKGLKVLFVVGLDLPPGLEQQRYEILHKALAPWRRADEEPLICLHAHEADLRAIHRKLAAGVNAVHILAHGAEADTTEGDQYGILLKGMDGNEGDIVTGERFASVLSSLQDTTKLPSAVVLASCDSAYQADVLVPGGSFARALHLARVPLVVASQFPLTVPASVRLTELLYQHILWGKHPLRVIAAARALVHAELGSTHDWASLVVYDALPDDVTEQLDEVRYHRAQFAIDGALKRLDDDGNTSFEDTRAKVTEFMTHFPVASPSYSMEVEGLRASYAKRLARRFFDDGQFAESRTHLEQAHRIYRSAAERGLQAGVAQQRKASIHWLETQALCLDRVLGYDPPEGAWSTALRAATLDAHREDREEQAWAHASLAELYLLALFDDPEGAFAKACDHAARILEFFPLASDFPVESTRRQFERYSDWWGDKPFGDLSGPRSDRWPDVRDAAREIVLTMPSAAG